MEQTQENLGIKYDSVALLPCDAAYMTEFDIYKGRTEEPSLILSGLGKMVPYEELKSVSLLDSNSLAKARVAYGTSDAMKLWAISRVDRIDDYLDSIVNDDSSLGFSEERFFFEFLLPALDEKVSVQYNSKICSLETLPENNMVLSGCGNMKSNQKIIENLTDR